MRCINMRHIKERATWKLSVGVDAGGLAVPVRGRQPGVRNFLRMVTDLKAPMEISDDNKDCLLCPAIF